MLKALSEQVLRLFSSAKNPGKKVCKLTDRLHTIKQVIVALSLTLIIGYKSFREHFECQPVGQLDKKTLTNFCYTNGTTTVDDASKQQSDTHVGLAWFKDDDGSRVISHNYIKSLWALIIIIGFCSYFPLRKWANLFRNDTLQALLKLPGFKESTLVSAAERARLYETLTGMSRELDANKRMLELEGQNLPKNEKLALKIAIVDDYTNIYNHKLDYYPNQLIYLLLTNSTRAYKSSDLKLAGKLIWYSLISTCATLLQFLIPIAFLGPDYASYGWNYVMLLKDYLIELLRSRKPVSYAVNTIDYHLSATLFPVATQCRYTHTAYTGGTDQVTVQCTVSINEICGKLFVLIWWVVLLNLFVELYSLLMICAGALHFKLMSHIYGLRFWPAARREANNIASFRFRRALMLKQLERARELRGQMSSSDLGGLKPKGGGRSDEMAINQSITSEHYVNAKALSPREKKRLEAELELGDTTTEYGDVAGDNICPTGSPIWLCTKTLCSALSHLISSLVCCLANRRQKYYEAELKRDSNIFYLLYLLYLRLGRSRTKVEEVIRMTSSALDFYMSDLELNGDHAPSGSGSSATHSPEPKPRNSTVGTQVAREQQKYLNRELLRKEGRSMVDVMM